MPIITNPIDWSAKYLTLHAWANGATGLTTRWADQDEPRPDFPYILLDIIATAKEGGIDEVSRTVDLTRARDVKVTPIARNTTTYTVTINAANGVFLSDATATVAEITAGLKAAIDLLGEPVIVTDNATDLDILGDPEVLNPTVPQLFTITVTDDFDGAQISRANNDAGSELEVRVTGSREFTLNAQAFERNTRNAKPASNPSTNAYNTLTMLQSSLGLPSVQEQLRGADISLIEELPIADLSEQVEDTLLSRASMDIRMRTLSVLLEHQGFIETVSGVSTFAVPGEPPVIDSISAP